MADLLKCAVGPTPRPRNRDNHMVSAVVSFRDASANTPWQIQLTLRQLPVIDVDMQQPYYYEPNTVSEVDPESETDSAREKRLVRKYSTSEGRKLTDHETEHVYMMDELERVYEIHPARSLDESFL